MIIFLFSKNNTILLYHENNKDKYMYVFIIFIIFYKINKKLILYTYQTRLQYQIDITRNHLFYFFYKKNNILKQYILLDKQYH